MRRPRWTLDAWPACGVELDELEGQCRTCVQDAYSMLLPETSNNSMAFQLVTSAEGPWASSGRDPCTVVRSIILVLMQVPS